MSYIVTSPQHALSFVTPRTFDRSGHGLAMLAGLVVATTVSSVAYQAPMGSGLNRKQQHGNIRNKDKLEGRLDRLASEDIVS